MLGKNKGYDPATDLLSVWTLSVATTGLDPTREGTILTRVGTALNIATNEAPYMLLKRVDSEGPTLADKLLQIDKGVLKTGSYVPVAILRDGQEWELCMYKSSGTNALSSSTAVGTRLGVHDGIIQEVAANGDGSTGIFDLVENNIATTNMITIRVNRFKGTA